MTTLTALPSKVGVPIGTIIAYGGLCDKDNTDRLIKMGWLYCDGQEIDRTIYQNLYKVIGDIHGRGDGVTSFNKPDYRGRFLRGVDDGAGRDPDASSRTAANIGGYEKDKVGSVQNGCPVKTFAHI